MQLEDKQNQNGEGHVEAASHVRSADEIFKEFKEHSVTEFFKKNSQMLGYAGKVRSLTTVVHEYVTNSLDACEEAGILPEITVTVKEIGEEKYSVTVSDNGPGIPKAHIGKALGSVLKGTKFHRNMQQRGQQGIGGSGCTLFAQITTGKPVHAKSNTGKEAYECDVSIDIRDNKPIVANMVQLPISQFKSTGLEVTGFFAGVKYENSDHGVYEYLRRTALSNPHAHIVLHAPDGSTVDFPRSVDSMPKRPRALKPHPLGMNVSDLMDFAKASPSRKLSSFLVDSFSRITYDKVDELKKLVPDLDFNKAPGELTWEEAEKLVDSFKKVKWLAPDLDALSTIGEKQIELAMRKILNPEFMSVVERRPKVFRGGIPFVVEAGIAYGGSAGTKTSTGTSGNVLRFANKVPLLFDGGSCAITEAVQEIDWKRYGIKNFDEEPVSVFVNVSSVYIPYSGVGKQAIAQEEEIIDEIKLAVMEAARRLQMHLSSERNKSEQASRYKTIMRYVEQLSSDLADITSRNKSEIQKSLTQLIESKYKSLFEDSSKESGQEADVAGSAGEEAEADANANN
ncbi:MAG: DNA topoisomerase VI subunit B [Candidatus Micrarchaeia archaeon]